MKKIVINIALAIMFLLMSSCSSNLEQSSSPKTTEDKEPASTSIQEQEPDPSWGMFDNVASVEVFVDNNLLYFNNEDAMKEFIDKIRLIEEAEDLELQLGRYEGQVNDVEELYDEKNKRSWLANVSGESDYADSAFSNKFADVNDNFICKRSQDAFLMFNIKWKDGIYGVWASHDDTRYVVSYTHNPDIKTMCYTASDMTPNLLLLNKSEHPLNKLLKRAFSNGYLYYEDLYIRDVIYDIVTKMGVRR